MLYTSNITVDGGGTQQVVEAGKKARIRACEPVV